MPSPFDPISLLKVLARNEVEYVLVGGMAAVLHGSPVVTSDADIMPSRTTDNLTHLGQALRDLDALIRSSSEPRGIPFDPHPELLRSVAILNLTTRYGDLDLVIAPQGIADYDTLRGEAVAFDIDGIAVQVAALDDIIHSKETADRPRDRAVLPLLYALKDELDR